MICNKCGKEIDKDFNLCPYCGEAISKPTCPKCKKELDENFNLCPYCGEDLKAPTNNTENLEEKPDPEHERGSGLIKFIFALVGLVFIGACIFGFVSSCPANKTAPSIRLEESLTGVTVHVEAEDDYDKVEIELQFYDMSGKLAYTTTLTGRNYKEGNTYTLTYTFSLSERFNYSFVQYRLESYR